MPDACTAVVSRCSFGTSDMYSEIKYDVYSNPPAKSVPANLSIYVWMPSEAAERSLEALSPSEAFREHTMRRLQDDDDKPDYTLVFSPVANDRCTWKPF